ncbi:HutD/Ves family protein [Sulfitobacter sp. TBRI5]|uniref:HutD/Ves family protein n=1 Tax=Sulfitobacter sp. TBRI5 TaxID=2989732 RepID=UPI003D9B8422
MSNIYWDQGDGAMRFDLNTCPKQPWKNGGGTTQELAVGYSGDALLWRLSMAQILADGPYSVFPGLRRIQTIVEGAGLHLSGPDQMIAVRPLQPVAFDGAVSFYAALRDGPCQALNLMFDPTRVQADMTVLFGPQCWSGIDETLLYCARGSVRCGAETLAQEAGIHCTGPVDIDVSSGAVAVLATLKPVR